MEILFFMRFFIWIFILSLPGPIMEIAYSLVSEGTATVVLIQHLERRVKNIWRHLNE